MSAAVQVRDCVPGDLPAVVDILEQKRRFNATLEPRFWKQAADSRAGSLAYFAELIATGTHVFLVAEREGTIKGFLLASPMRTPPPYDAGPTAVIDDFYVARSELWTEVGTALLVEARAQLKRRGIAQFVIVSAYRDDAKMAFLGTQGLSLNAAWFNAAV